MHFPFGRTASSLVFLLALPAWAQQPPANLAPPVERGAFLVPASGKESEPFWGVRGGIAIGLWPTPGPRGLIRIYAPYLGQPRLREVNFIAIEPVAKGQRCLSELEWSELDQIAGKRFWTVESHEGDPKPAPSWVPVPARIDRIDGAERLTVVIASERFENGAQPIIEAELRSDRPHEVTFRVYAAKSSDPMVSCVLTATMGNYARLRKLYLKNEVIDALTLWKQPEFDRYGFVPHRQWSVEALPVRDDEVYVLATPDEPDPAKAEYAAGTGAWWRYEGKPARQFWRAPVVPGLVARVNGRTTYWASNSPIPGGMAFENFELEAPFRPGQEFRFGVLPAE